MMLGAAHTVHAGTASTGRNQPPSLRGPCRTLRVRRLRARSRDTSLLYVVAVVYPFIYALAPQTLFEQEPKYLVVLSPILVLLLAQVATRYWRAVVVTAIACAISVVTLQRLETYFRTVPPYPPAAPRDLGPLISTLDELGVDRVYADFWVAYRLDFETNERIIASQNKFTHLTSSAGRQSRHITRTFATAPTSERSSRHRITVSYSSEPHSVGSAAIVAQLQEHGYRHVVVGPFVVYILRK